MPTHITDFRREWATPIERYLADADLDSFPVLAHSAGGLTTAHLDAPGITNRVYLSPWWGTDPPLPEQLSRTRRTHPRLETDPPDRPRRPRRHR
nr:hypothetical protein [Halomicroarcula sp. SYNS111]